MKKVIKRSSGFSLIELIVVLVILLILLSLLFPTFTRAKYAAKESVCLHNVRQLLLVIEMYSTDYDGQAPWQQPGSLALRPYLGGKVFKCPVAAGKSSSMRLSGSDYQLNSALPPVTGNIPLYVQVQFDAWRECRQIRGSEFPVVLDLNHSSAVERVERGIAFVILGRAGGSAEKVVDRTKEFLRGAPSPCDPDLLHLNL